MHLPLSRINRALAFCACLLIPAALACSLLQSSPKSPAQASHDCFVSVLEPAFGDLTEDVLRAMLAGGSTGAILRVHNIPEDQALKILAGMNACLLPVASPSADAPNARQM